MNEDLGRKQYDAALKDNGSESKGVYMGKRPYLWREEKPAEACIDTPCQNFVPMPTIYTGEDKGTAKRAIKIGLLVALVALAIVAGVIMLLENPEILKLGDANANYF